MVRYFLPMINSSFMSINIDTASSKSDLSLGNAPTKLTFFQFDYSKAITLNTSTKTGDFYKLFDFSEFAAI